MSTSPVGPEDVRAAAEVRRELGPEYDDAVVAAFIDRVDREVAARVQARLSESAGTQVDRRAKRRSLVKGVAIGLCAGGLIGFFGLIHARETGPAGGAPYTHTIPFPKGQNKVPLPKSVPKGNFPGNELPVPAKGQSAGNTA
jgi:hypothetical protein